MKRPLVFMAIALALATAPSVSRAADHDASLDALEPLMRDYFAAQCEKTRACPQKTPSQKKECDAFSKRLIDSTLEQMREESVVVTASHLERAKTCTAEIRKMTCEEIAKALPESCGVWDSWDRTPR